MKKAKGVVALLLSSYVIGLLYLTVCIRDAKDNPSIYTELFWSYHRRHFPFMTIDSAYNILVYIPIGILIGSLINKYRLIIVLLTGLFLSETVECLQLIFKKGAFDVDDLFNNTLGAILGGLLIEMIVWFKRNNIKYEINKRI